MNAVPSPGSRIRLLPAEIVNQIAAGEVVERPASVVKELVENAIDAQSSRIEVTLEQGGRRLIRVTDDGIGMSTEDLALVFRSHATSKLTKAEDLFSVQTLGFRGEALASIGAVSQARIVSRARGALTGGEVTMEGGRLGEVKAAGAPEGTTVEVRNLFFNLPARRKFLRSVQTELAHSLEAVTRIALASPTVAFTVIHERREVLRLPPAEGAADRIAALFGNDLVRSLLPFETQSEALRCFGFIAPPHLDRATGQMQYVFLNGRYIRDKLISRAISEAYRGLIMSRRFPICFLFLEMDPRMVDVNVHPTKIEVRFRSPGAIYSALLAALQEALRQVGPAPLELPKREKTSTEAPPAERASHRERIRQAISAFFDSIPTPERGGATAASATGSRPSSLREASPRVGPQQMPPPPPRAQKTPAVSAAQPSPKQPAHPMPQPLEAAPPPRRFYQVHNTYILEETAEGIHLIDQHALHERILYEELLKQRENGKTLKQRLLVPEVLELSPKEFGLVIGLRDRLDRLGIEIIEFGANTIAIQALPQMLRIPYAAQFVRDVIEEFAEQPIEEAHAPDVGSSEEMQKTHPGVRHSSPLFDRLIQIIACKAAVKAGDRLEPEQIEALLERRDAMRLDPTCPHGRPTTIFFSLADLERQFRRR